MMLNNTTWTQEAKDQQQDILKIISTLQKNKQATKTKTTIREEKKERKKERKKEKTHNPNSRHY